MMNITRLLLLITLLLTMQYRAEAQSEPDIIWHTPGVAGDFMTLSPDGQYVFVNTLDKQNPWIPGKFTQLRVEDGTIVVKEYNQIGCVIGYSADERHIITFKGFGKTARHDVKMYKCDASTFEIVDSLDMGFIMEGDPEGTYRYIISAKLSNDRQRIYLGGNRNPEHGNYYVIDTETFEVLYSKYFQPNPLYDYTVSDIYVSPSDEYLAIKVNEILMILDVKQNYQVVHQFNNFGTQTENSSVINSAYSLDMTKLFIAIQDFPEDKILIYNTIDYKLVDSLLYQYYWTDDKTLVDENRLTSILISKNSNDFFVGQYIGRLTKINTSTIESKCVMEFLTHSENFLYPGYSIITNDGEHIIASFRGDILGKFAICSSTNVTQNNIENVSVNMINNELHIKLLNFIYQNIEYKIYDINGNINLQSVHIQKNNEFIIDVGTLSPGTYFLTLQIGEEMLNYKFMVVR